MNNILETKLDNIAKNLITKDDPSHDILHSLRVKKLVKKIGAIENADLDILIPCALFHDLINHPKGSDKAKDSSVESAKETGKILREINEYPKQKIPAVEYAISICSFTKNIMPTTIEAKILQDADMLEATGAIAVMRTYSSCGVMKMPFYCEDDPFCKTRNKESMGYALDLFYNRLLIVEKRMHTYTAKQIARRRTRFLENFLEELELELFED